VRYLADYCGKYVPTIVLADSSWVALTMAGKILPPGVDRYQIDLMNSCLEAQNDTRGNTLLHIDTHLTSSMRSFSFKCHEVPQFPCGWQMAEQQKTCDKSTFKVVLNYESTILSSAL